MPLSDKSVQEFKEIFEKEYGKKLSDDEARESTENLISFFSVLIKIDQKNEDANK